MSALEGVLYYDGELCVGCHSCEVACKVEHDLPVGVNRVGILVEGPTIINGELKQEFKRVGCKHCTQPPCIKVCPTGAIKKREEDGIVFIDQPLCTGCQLCAEACPYDAICFHPEKYWAEICDFCIDRLDKGLPPFCVQHCMSGALFFGTKKEYEERRRTWKNRQKS